MSDPLQRWLASADLDEFYPFFKAKGVSEENFTELQFQDYDSVGITGHSDRQKLFKLIQVVKRELEAVPPPAAPEKKPSSARPSTSRRTRERETKEPSPKGDDGAHIPKIQVAVRKRPLNRKETERGEPDVASVKPSDQSIIIHEPKQKVDLTKYVESHNFNFDAVYNKKSTNALIYERTCKPLVNFFFNKGNVTCFAYGQTGSGKTYTMMGPGGGKGAQSGLYVLAAKDIFEKIQLPRYENLKVYVSFFEIYGGKLFDLLNGRKKLLCREDGSKSVNIVGLRERKCESVDGLMEMIAHGNSVRSTGVTGANIDSSRSHAILQVALKKMVEDKSDNPYAQKGKMKQHTKFSFIDLAGSERAADTSNNCRRTRLEGAEINKSLLALKECIRAMDQNAKHRPFRGSKLTQVLKDSLVGNSKTIMIANISPNAGACEHTLNTLRYADRVKDLTRDNKKNSSHNAYMPHQDSSNRKQSAVEKRGNGNVPTTVVEVPSDDETEAKDNLVQTHHELCSEILQEEEDIVEAHRGQIDMTMQLVKEEMELLKQFDILGYSVDEYVDKLDLILAKKVASVQALRDRLSIFKSHLQKEEMLSSSFSRKNR